MVKSYNNVNSVEASNGSEQDDLNENNKNIVNACDVRHLINSKGSQLGSKHAQPNEQPQVI